MASVPHRPCHDKIRARVPEQRSALRAGARSPEPAGRAQRRARADGRSAIGLLPQLLEVPARARAGLGSGPPRLARSRAAGGAGEPPGRWLGRRRTCPETPAAGRPRASRARALGRTSARPPAPSPGGGGGPSRRTRSEQRGGPLHTAAAPPRPPRPSRAGPGLPAGAAAGGGEAGAAEGRCGRPRRARGGGAPPEARPGPARGPSLTCRAGPGRARRPAAPLTGGALS